MFHVDPISLSTASFPSMPAPVKDISQQVKDKIKFANKIIMIASAIAGMIALGVAAFFLGGVPAILLGGFVWALLNFTASPIAETLIEKYLPRHLKA